MPESSTAPSPTRPPVAPSRPELLAPAGDWECARAAVENGADAIYFGLEKFNARMRAHNFTAADLPELMRYLHRRGVKGYVTFNTLVFANELAEAEEYLRTIISSGADAAIVQDVGICRMIRALSSDFPIHCSTQMTISSAAGVEFARELGANLVVLARENTIADIEKMREATGGTMPLEVFVHGALCVAYSGQCLTSESLGGRSANRGECAQACRMPYDLISDGKQVPLGDRRYLLSPRDLAGIEVLPELVRIGVASLKIEGRLKSAEYVASITRTYRAALDRAMAATVTRPDFADFGYELEMAFSRGLATGWFRGINNQELVHARFGTKRGVFLGKVTRVTHDGVLVRLEGPVKPGDGIVLDQGKHDEGEQGGRVYHVRASGADHELTFGHDAIDLRRVKAGDRIWKTNDPALDRELRKTFEGDAPRFTRPITAEVHGHAGVPLTLLLRDGEGRTVRADSTVPLARAETRPLNDDLLVAQLGRLGGTPFKLGTLLNKLEPGLMLPVSELNHVRRDAAAKLEALRAEPPRWRLSQEEVGALIPKRPSVVHESNEEGRLGIAAPTPRQPQLIASVRDIAQMEAAWEAGARSIYCEFEDPKKYREAVARFRELQASGSDSAGSEIWVLPPRISKPDEDWIHRIVASCQPDGILARNHDHLSVFAGRRLRGDFSLNVANPWTVSWLRERYGLERLTASYDLNVTQLEALLESTNAAALDITIHQHMPMFHMEHCVFCAFLSDGTDYRNCGRPCDHHDVRLRDRVGAEHPLKADAGCRNTVYNSRAQTGAEYVSRMVALGARHFRVDFLNESPAEVGRILGRYAQLLRGEIRGSELWGEFKLINQLGVTRGQLDAPTRVIVPKGVAEG
jgi:putative protease